MAILLTPWDSAQPLQYHVMRVQRLAGTRDFAPDDYRLRQWLFGEFEAVSRLFGFEQFETPVLESEELFVRKAGEEITQQLYNFEVYCSFRLTLGLASAPALSSSPILAMCATPEVFWDGPAQSHHLCKTPGSCSLHPSQPVLKQVREAR